MAMDPQERKMASENAKNMRDLNLVLKKLQVKPEEEASLLKELGDSINVGNNQLTTSLSKFHREDRVEGKFESKRQDKRFKELINAQGRVFGVFGRMSNTLKNMFGLMPNRAALKRQKAADISAMEQRNISRRQLKAMQLMLAATLTSKTEARENKAEEIAKSKGEAAEDKSRHDQLISTLAGLDLKGEGEEKRGGLLSGLIGGAGGLGLAGVKAAVLGLPAALNLAGVLLKSPLGQIAGAGILGYKAGEWISKNLIVPWIDDFYEKEAKIQGTAGAVTTGQSTVVDESGKEQKIFRLDSRLAKKYGTGALITEDKAKEIAKAEGFESVDAMSAKFMEGSGLKAESFKKSTESGVALQGTEEQYTEEGLKKRSEAIAAQREAQEVSLFSDDAMTRELTKKKLGINRVAKLALMNERQLYGYMAKGFGQKADAVENEKRAQAIAETVSTQYYAAMKSKDPDVTAREKKAIFRQFPLSYALARSPELFWSSTWGVRYDRSSSKYFPYPSASGIPRSADGYVKKFGMPGANWDGSKVWSDYVNAPGPVALASGGLAMAPLRAFVAEKEPELVLPLSKAPSFISEVLTKASESLSATNVGMQDMLSSMSKRGAGGIGNTPQIVTNTVMTNQNNAYTSSNPSVRNPIPRPAGSVGMGI
jgi:hypothetical protein